jgi:hypothetical protein
MTLLFPKHKLRVLHPVSYPPPAVPDGIRITLIEHHEMSLSQCWSTDDGHKLTHRPWLATFSLSPPVLGLPLTLDFFLN